jgi:hypothetical protein
MPSRVGVPAARKGVDFSNSVRSVETMPLKTLADVMICGNHVIIHSRRVQAKILPRCFGFFGIRGKCAADKLDVPVEPSAHSVNSADEGAASSTDHSHLQFMLHRLTCFEVADRHGHGVELLIPGEARSDQRC